jgi:hypothetical protein
MEVELSKRDPIASYARKATATRRVGKGKRCACGEKRPEALIAGSNPMICIECERKREGKTTMDKSHGAGEANSPATTSVPANDHSAELNVAQYDWPKQTLQNPDGDPLLAAAGCVRGFVDNIIYYVKKFLLWIPEMLESLSRHLKEKLGDKWWVGTALEQFVPER